MLSLLTKIASGYWHVADSQSGYTAIGLSTLQKLDLDRVYPRYGFPNDLLVHLNVRDARVRDVPSRPVYNVGEQSGIRYSRVVPTISWLLLKAFFWRLKEKYVIRDFHPLVFFYVLGLLMFLVGLGLGIAESCCASSATRSRRRPSSWSRCSCSSGRSSSCSRCGSTSSGTRISASPREPHDYHERA